MYQNNVQRQNGWELIYFTTIFEDGSRFIQ